MAIRRELVVYGSVAAATLVAIAWGVIENQSSEAESEQRLREASIGTPTSRNDVEKQLRGLAAELGADVRRVDVDPMTSIVIAANESDVCARVDQLLARVYLPVNCIEVTCKRGEVVELQRLSHDGGFARVPVDAPECVARTATPAYERTVPRGCCKHCDKGKPCGDTCIARNRTCNSPPGCAC